MNENLKTFIILSFIQGLLVLLVKGAVLLLFGFNIAVFPAFIGGLVVFGVEWLFHFGPFKKA